MIDIQVQEKVSKEAPSKVHPSCIPFTRRTGHSLTLTTLSDPTQTYCMIILIFCSWTETILKKSAKRTALIHSRTGDTKGAGCSSIKATAQLTTLSSQLSLLSSFNSIAKTWKT